MIQCPCGTVYISATSWITENTSFIKMNDITNHVARQFQLIGVEVTKSNQRGGDLKRIFFFCLKSIFAGHMNDTWISQLINFYCGVFTVNISKSVIYKYKLSIYFIMFLISGSLSFYVFSNTFHFVKCCHSISLWDTFWEKTSSV